MEPVSNPQTYYHIASFKSQTQNGTGWQEMHPVVQLGWCSPFIPSPPPGPYWLSVGVSQYTSGTPAKSPTPPPTHLSWAASAGCRAKKFTLFLLKSYITMLAQSLIHSVTVSYLAYCEHTIYVTVHRTVSELSQTAKTTNPSLWSPLKQNSHLAIWSVS